MTPPKQNLHLPGQREKSRDLCGIRSQAASSASEFSLELVLPGRSRRQPDTAESRRAPRGSHSLGLPGSAPPRLRGHVTPLGPALHAHFRSSPFPPRKKAGLLGEERVPDFLPSSVSAPTPPHPPTHPRTHATNEHFRVAPPPPRSLGAFWESSSGLPLPSPAPRLPPTSLPPARDMRSECRPSLLPAPPPPPRAETPLQPAATAAAAAAQAAAAEDEERGGSGARGAAGLAGFKETGHASYPTATLKP